MADSVRIPAGRVRLEPYASRETCKNNHPWTPETTRWRKRTRPGRGTTVERDCLVCKHVSEGKRQRRRAVDRRWM